MSETAKKKSPGRIVLTVGCIIVGVVLLILLAARLYFRIPVHEYYANSEKTFVIPGLSDGMIVQGLAYDSGSDWFYVTGYRSDGKASQVGIVSKQSGNEVKRLSLADKDGSAYNGHVGGITVSGSYVYVASSKGLVVYSRDDFEKANDGDSVKSLGIFSTVTDNDKLGVAYTHAQDGMIYVGEFYREANYPTPDSHKYKTAAGDSNTALILAYKLDADAEFGISPQIEAAYSTTGLVQGMCFDGNGRFCLSTSYGPAFSHIYVYNNPKQEGNIDVLGQNVPLYALDSSCLAHDIKIAPMAEEIVFVDGKLYTMCESASNKYIFGKFTSAKYCYATDLTEYEK